MVFNRECTVKYKKKMKAKRHFYDFISLNNCFLQEGFNPNFLRTILLSKRLKEITRLKFVIYNVINRAKSDVSLFL